MERSGKNRRKFLFLLDFLLVLHSYIFLTYASDAEMCWGGSREATPTNLLCQRFDILISYIVSVVTIKMKL